MKLVYTVEMADLVTFNQYHLDHSEFVKSRRRKSITIVCGIYVIPKARVIGGDYDAFMRTIMEKWKSQ
jgi:pantothenate synthetase